MKKDIVKLLFWGVFIFFLSVQKSYARSPVEALVKRILPEHKDKFIFEQVESESNKDFFELSTRENKIVITGNTPVSIAFGLNWYLKYYCNCSLSFCGNQLKVPNHLPLMKNKFRKETPLSCNFYMNYCTFGYTTVFWDWKRWEREIDLMALNGVTVSMAMVGVEAVWRNTLRRFDYSDDEIKNFLSGPAFLPWFLMGNLERHGGPLPDEWFERQVGLQRKILRRMKEYGIQPVFQAFWGMVPGSLHLKFPKAKLIEQGEWMGFKRPPILLPTDSLFTEMAKVWYEEYDSLFGQADRYAGDLFHEGGSSEGVDLPKVAAGVQKSLLAYNPQAKWFIQAWGENPKPELLKGLDRKHTVIIDLSAEYWTRWKERSGFEGFPWIWSHITNYGGNIGLHGRLGAIAGGVTDALSDSCASKSLCGIGATPEGIEVNPVVFDLANEMRWRKNKVDMNDWIVKYANRRYGLKSTYLENAWQIFYQTAYGTYPQHRRPSESVFCALPSLKGEKITASAWSQCKIFYDPEKFAEGVELLLKEYKKLEHSETYTYDVADMVRQYLSNLGRSAYYAMVDAYNHKNKKDFCKYADYFLDILLDQDRLLSAFVPFSVGTWIANAKNASSVKSVQDLYEYNARLLIATWSDQNTVLRDYAHREWGGMLRDYYYPRWRAFIAYLKSKMNGYEVDKPDFFTGEKAWTESTTRYLVNANENGEGVRLAKEIFEKYYESDK